MLTAGVLVALGASALAGDIPSTCVTAPANRTVSAAEFASGAGQTIENPTATYGSKTCPRTYVVEYTETPALGGVLVDPWPWPSNGRYPGVLTQAECERIVVTARMWSFGGKWLPVGEEVREPATWLDWAKTCSARSLQLRVMPGNPRIRIAVRAEKLGADAGQPSTLGGFRLTVSPYTEGNLGEQPTGETIYDVPEAGF